MSDSEPPPSERRTGIRHLACFAASVERPDGKTRTAMIRDLSESGALVLVRTNKLAVGDPVKLELYIMDDPKEFRTASGHVVRVELLGEKAAGLWSRKIAVEFDAPITIY